MTNIPAPDTDACQRSTPAKAAWTKPIIDVIEIDHGTQAGGMTFADVDPNQPGVS
ncbi:hypothetical protein [Zavarzinia sp. CC-PAN008]|uniref:hypothetical protein n=1 Tax=Zavarzinia sp. CC-PAN008 TaxID=3243332 RepID=UPI003F7447CA